MTPELPIREIPRPPMEVSKWLKSPVLLDAEEMQALLKELAGIHFYFTQSVTPFGKGEIPSHDFLEVYKNYISELKEGRLPEETNYRLYFSAALTAASDSLYAIRVGEESQLIRVAKPVIQLQSHHIARSPVDGKFHAMTFGTNSISWGIQFSYPQLFRDPDTLQILNVDDSHNFPNTLLFRTLQHWVRHNTVPTPLQIGEEKITLPIRLGKNCVHWINRHPQLIQQGIQVSVKETE